MRLAARNGTVLATILVIAVVAAALAIMCPFGVHLPISGSMGRGCIAMTHSSVLGVAVAATGSPVPLSPLLAIGVGSAMALTLARSSPVGERAAIVAGRSIDPLNGRLRL